MKGLNNDYKLSSKRIRTNSRVRPRY
jgi:hypothetical protein